MTFTATTTTTTCLSISRYALLCTVSAFHRVLGQGCPSTQRQTSWQPGNSKERHSDGGAFPSHLFLLKLEQLDVLFIHSDTRKIGWDVWRSQKSSFLVPLKCLSLKCFFFSNKVYFYLRQMDQLFCRMSLNLDLSSVS